MDLNISARLDNRKGNSNFDAPFAGKVQQTAKDYIESGLRNLNWATSDFDAATDIADMLQPIDSIVGAGQNFASVDRNSALCFRDPAGFTQLHVLTTFLAEILFGGEQSREVEAQKEEDSEKADDVNALLAWNDQKQKIYLQGWLWIWNAVVYNRGVWYEDTDKDCEVIREEVEEDDITAKPIIQKDEKGKIVRDADGKPIKSYPKRTRVRNKRVYSGFFNRLNIVSPYDFISDPSRSTLTFQEGRYCGHRVLIPWLELKRRSELEPSDQDYVLPHVVLKMKSTGTNAVVPAPVGGTVGLNNSRTYWERTQRGGGIARGGIGGSGVGAGAGVDGVNKDDGGTIECFVLFIRARPKTLEMYDDEEFEIIKILTTSTGDVLSVQCQPNKHDQFPYAFAESLPNAVRQFTPGWGLKCKPVQDRIDDLNVTHSTAMKRMGNILLIDPAKCDFKNLLTPDKNGLMIMRTAEGKGVPMDEVVGQIPLTDTTANYNDEADRWEKKMEDMTGANSYVQGQTEDPNQTLGQFTGVQKMATGRVTSIARLLAEQGIMPQTMRWVSNFTQFASDEQMVRITGKANQDMDLDDPKKPKWKLIKGTDLVGSYEIVPYDPSLPGADAKIVAAAARTVEAYAGNPALAPAFDVKIPGSIDPIKVFQYMLQKSGLPVERFVVSKEEAQQNTQNAMAAAQIQGGSPGAPGATGAPAQPVTTPPLPPALPADANLPSAGILPPNPSASVTPQQTVPAA